MGWTGGGRGYNLRVETVRKQPQPDASIVYLTFSARLSPTRNLYLGKIALLCRKGTVLNQPSHKDLVMWLPE